MKRPFAVVGLTLFFVTAFFLDYETGVAASAFVMFAVSLVVSLLFGQIRKHGFLPLFFASCAVSCALLVGVTSFVYLPVISYDGSMNCAIKAEIIGSPEFRYGNCYINSRVLSLNGEDADFKIRLVFSTPPDAEPYDVVEGSFNLYALGASDESIMQSYKSQGVFLGGYPVNGVYSVIEVAESEKPFAKKILDLRESIKGALYRAFPGDSGGLAVSLIIGDRDGLSDEIYGDFKKLGISHIICVSGFHLSLWSMLILDILKKTGMKRWPADILAGIGVFMLMSVAGFTYSVIRAGVMMLVFLLSDIFMRRRDSLNSLGFALAVIILINPFAAGSVSLKLSALATLGIILYNEYISKRLNRIIFKIKHNIIRKAASGAVSSFMITFFATAFTLPVSLALYGSFNYMCFPANMLIVPLAGCSMVTCSVAALFEAFLPSRYNFIAYAGDLILNIIIKASDYLADYDFSVFRINDEKVVILLGGLFVFCLMSVFVSYFIKPVYGWTSILCAVIFTVSIVTFSNSENKETKITAADCGNGISVLISCNGENMLVGCGGTDFFGSTRISEAISDSGSGIDAAVIPNSDEKFSAYLYRIFAENKPEKVYYDSLPEGVELLLYGSEKGGFSELSGTENIHAEGVVVNDCCCVYTQTDDISALICFDPSFDFNSLPEPFKNTDVIISRGNFPAGCEYDSERLYVLLSEGVRADIIKEKLMLKGVRCVTTGNGDVVVRAEDSNVSVNS
ncbi:MAG: ComEC/Rec2 family competence protein [Clostridia bacterium]|nr:ComEC/Rec2 family competence protein [Clostridia bacterium]